MPVAEALSDPANVLLTLHIHQRADISAAHRVGHLAGHGVGEVGLIDRHLQTVPVGFGDGDATFGPPFGAQGRKPIK